MLNKIFGWIVFLFFIGWLFSFLWIPQNFSPIQRGEQYDKALASVNGFIAEAGVSNKGFEKGLTDVISALQQHPVWGWKQPADGIISEDFLNHLTAKARAYSDANVKEKVLEFVAALRVLQNGRYIWEFSSLKATSLAFANGIFVGWADDFGAWVFNRDDSRKRDAARDDYKKTVLLGEVYYPVATLVFTILGTVFSIFGVIAVWMARNADNEKHAFKLGFWAEMGESALFQFGYFYTTKKNGVTLNEAGMTFVVAIFMGFVAMWMYKSHQRAKNGKAT